MKFLNLSIKRKLILMTMLTSSMALFLSSASFLIYDLISFRHLLTQDLTTQAEIIGYNSAAAIAFKDEHAASATLRIDSERRHRCSCVIQPTGKNLRTLFSKPT